MFRVTIEQIDESGRVVAFSMRMGDEDDGLGAICGSVINAIGMGRPDMIVAEIIDSLDFGDETPHEFFSGRGARIESMASSASAIIDGWKAFDEKTR